MGSSRESSPDWLRSFKVPTHSPLTLSSDSGSLQDGSPSVEDKADNEESSLKSPTLPEIYKKENTGPGKSFAESPPRLTVEAVSLKTEDRTPSRRKKVDNQKKEGDKKKKKVFNEGNIAKHIKNNESIHSVWTLSSDSESCDHSPKREDHINQVGTYGHQKFESLDEEKCGDEVLVGNDGKSPSKKHSKGKLSQKQDVDNNTTLSGKKTKGRAKGKGDGGDLEVKEEGTSEKLVEPNVSSSRLPLMLSEKVQRTKALIECEGDSIDLSGDVGAVGRIMISDSPSGDQEMYLDLKGTIYKTSIIPSRTFCIVSFGQSEAKIEAIMNDFIQLKPQSNVYEAETMVEGTLDGFSFDSDEEADKLSKAIPHQADENEDVEEQTNKKAKGKADKTSGATKKRGRSAGGKPPAPKKVRKKAQGSKKAKAKK